MAILQGCPMGKNISSKSLYLAHFSRYKHYCVLQKIGKFKMAAIFGETKTFLKFVMATPERYPVGHKSCRNRPI